MTVREAFGTILYEHYLVKVEHNALCDIDDLPEEALDREIHRIAPRHTEEGDNYYLIRLQEVRV